MRFFISLVFLFCLWEATISQNLIPNGSFERFKPTSQSKKIKKINDLEGGWEAFTETIREANKPNIAICRNCSTIADGQINVYYNNFEGLKDLDLKRKVLQVPLKQELKKDSLYQLSFYLGILLLYEKPNSIIDPHSLQYYFSDLKLNKVIDLQLINYNCLSFILPESKTYKEYQERKSQIVTTIYKAKGGEKYLIIGTFKPQSLKCRYAFSFDDFKLEPVSEILVKISNTNIGSSFIMDHISFETNKFNLLKSSLITLEQLIKAMEQTQNLNLEISGHTDNTGTVAHNNKLSEQRAKAIVDYLVSHGIEQKRLIYKGYGSSQPIADNKTEDGRAKNRRVEITILDK
jgi:outer membrane protein OmpA-like peptidoglycan-associated protein